MVYFLWLNIYILFYLASSVNIPRFYYVHYRILFPIHYDSQFVFWCLLITNSPANHTSSTWRHPFPEGRHRWAHHLPANRLTFVWRAVRQSELVSGFSQLSVSPATTPSGPEDHERRAAWERGQMDYMGSDSFDNILSKMQQTLQK